MLLNIIDLIAGAFIVLLLGLIGSASESELREKIGGNYEAAIS